MDKIDMWSAPQSESLLAAYQAVMGELHLCDDHAPDNLYAERAAQTFAVWEASQRLPDADFLMVKSNDNTSLAFRNGGVVVEGSKSLNIGLIRAKTRTLDPVSLEVDSFKVLSSEDRFRRLFWAILARLQGAVLARIYAFDLGCARGDVFVKDGNLRFSGDFTSPSEFVDELRASCEVPDKVAYTVASIDSIPDAQDYPVKDLINEIAIPSDDKCLTFDSEGWPIACARDVQLETVQNIAAIAQAIGQIKERDVISVSILSNKNDQILSSKINADGNLEFTVH